VLLEVTPRTSQSISITPLIDVVFILLLFFMLSSTFSKTKQLELEAAAPGSLQSSAAQHSKILLLADNQVELNGEHYPLHSEHFAQQLQRIVTNKESVTLAAIATVKVQDTIQLIDMLRAAGITQLNLSPSVTP
jgi:biopolymer transport protein ExbD